MAVRQSGRAPAASGCLFLLPGTAQLVQICVTLPHLVLGLFPGEKPMKVRGTLMSLNPRHEKNVSGWQISIVKNRGKEVELLGSVPAWRAAMPSPSGATEQILIPLTYFPLAL